MAQTFPVRQRLKAAQAIHSQLIGTHAASLMPLPADLWQTCRHLQQLSIRANSLGRFPLARERLRREQRLGCLRLVNELQRHSAPSPAEHQFLPTVRDIFEDLVALDAEFESATICLKSRTVAVDTGEIVLEDVGLGPFRITLNWLDIGRSYSAYTVKALQSNRSAVRGGSVHPHVDGESLCAGDGRLAIDCALKQGRIGDFFLTVRQILQTYNSDNAYVQLSDWSGRHCRACADTVSSSDIRSCDICETGICSDCATHCTGCSDLICPDCTAACAGCDVETCSGCLTTCDGCVQQFCEGCLNYGECDECRTDAEEEEDVAETPEPPFGTASPTAAHAAVHSVFVGQTAVPS